MLRETSPIHRDRTRRRRIQTKDHSHRRRLTRTVRTQKPGHDTRPHHETQPVNRDLVAIPFRQLTRFDHVNMPSLITANHTQRTLRDSCEHQCGNKCRRDHTPIHGLVSTRPHPQQRRTTHDHSPSSTSGSRAEVGRRVFRIWVEIWVEICPLDPKTHQARTLRTGPDLHLPEWRGWDLNPRPSGYEPDELPNCSTPRCGHHHSAVASSRQPPRL